MTCDTWGGIQGSLGMAPTHYYSALKNSMLYYTKILLFPEWVHSFISLSLCFYCFFCLEWHFIPSLSRKFLCFKTHWWKRPRMNGASENKERGNFKKEAVWDTGVAYTTSFPPIPPSFHPAIVWLGLTPSQLQQRALTDRSLSSNPVPLLQGWAISA